MFDPHLNSVSMMWTLVCKSCGTMDCLRRGDRLTNVGFTEQPAFARVRDELLGGDDGFRALQTFLSNNPRAGGVIQGTNGLRKMRYRMTGANRGKSGGIRVINLYIEEQARIIFYAAYAKNRLEDLTAAQKHVLFDMVRQEKDRQL